MSRTSQRSELSLDGEGSGITIEITEHKPHLLWILVQINKVYLKSKENNIQ